MLRDSNERLLSWTIARWGALGAGFDEPKIPVGTPDLERLLLDTARCVPNSARLLAVACTWLRTYADVVASHRLKRLIQAELEPEHHAAMGLLLDAAQEGEHQPAFAWITKTLERAHDERPLFVDQRTNAALAQLARRRASALSKRWGLWCAPIEVKGDALRPARWVMERHQSFMARADFRGDLRASVLAALRFDDGAGHSESALARLAGGSRSQVREALENLRLTGRVEVTPATNGRRNEIRIAA